MASLTRAERDQERWHSPIGRYHARPTNNVQRVGMNYLSNLIIRPGIEKCFGPLLLYRGNMNRGHAHRLWNASLMLMAAECETLADGLKVLNNEAFSQLCGPVKLPTKITLRSYFGRLVDNPAVTKNIDGFTDYVKFMGLGDNWLTRVDRFSERADCAPWRMSLHPDAADYVPKERGIVLREQLFYPYIAHDARQNGDQALALLVNSAVPSHWPDHMRADICQDLVVGVLTGEIAPGDVHDHVSRNMQKYFKDYPMYWEGGAIKLSFNAPVPGTEDMAWTERV